MTRRARRQRFNGAAGKEATKPRRIGCDTLFRELGWRALEAPKVRNGAHNLGTGMVEIAAKASIEDSQRVAAHFPEGPTRRSPGLGRIGACRQAPAGAVSEHEIINASWLAANNY